MERVETIRYLGIMLDSNLSFKTHVDKLRVKLSGNVGMMQHLCHLLPYHPMRWIYLSLIHSYTNYSAIIYANPFKTHLHPLQVHQSKTCEPLWATFLHHHLFQTHLGPSTCILCPESHFNVFRIRLLATVTTCIYYCDYLQLWLLVYADPFKTHLHPLQVHQSKTCEPLWVTFLHHHLFQTHLGPSTCILCPESHFKVFRIRLLATVTTCIYYLQLWLLVYANPFKTHLHPLQVHQSKTCEPLWVTFLHHHLFQTHLGPSTCILCPESHFKVFRIRLLATVSNPENLKMWFGTKYASWRSKMSLE